MPDVTDAKNSITLALPKILIERIAEVSPDSGDHATNGTAFLEKILRSSPRGIELSGGVETSKLLEIAARTPELVFPDWRRGLHHILLGAGGVVDRANFVLAQLEIMVDVGHRIATKRNSSPLISAESDVVMPWAWCVNHMRRLISQGRPEVCLESVTRIGWSSLSTGDVRPPALSSEIYAFYDYAITDAPVSRTWLSHNVDAVDACVLELLQAHWSGNFDARHLLAGFVERFAPVGYPFADYVRSQLDARTSPMETQTRRDLRALERPGRLSHGSKEPGLTFLRASLPARASGVYGAVVEFAEPCVFAISSSEVAGLFALVKGRAERFAMCAHVLDAQTVAFSFAMNQRTKLATLSSEGTVYSVDDHGFRPQVDKMGEFVHYGDVTIQDDLKIHGTDLADLIMGLPNPFARGMGRHDAFAAYAPCAGGGTILVPFNGLTAEHWPTQHQYYRNGRWHSRLTHRI